MWSIISSLVVALLPASHNRCASKMPHHTNIFREIVISCWFLLHKISFLHKESHSLLYILGLVFCIEYVWEPHQKCWEPHYTFISTDHPGLMSELSAAILETPEIYSVKQMHIQTSRVLLIDTYWMKIDINCCLKADTANISVFKGVSRLTFFCTSELTSACWAYFLKFYSGPPFWVI